MRAALRALAAEVRGIAGDPGALLVLVGAVVLYAAFYPTPYLGEVLKEVPVAVVDADHTLLSRRLVRMADAHELVRISAAAPSLAAGERLVRDGGASGLLVIPEGFERDVKAGRPAWVGAFADASYFLVYRQVLTGLAESAGALSAGVEIRCLEAQGLPEAKARRFRDPVPLVTRPLFNPAEGYASYVVPGVLILILQQTLLIGIGLRGAAPHPVAGDAGWAAATAVTLGRAAAYTALYAVHLFFYLAVVGRLYGFSARGTARDAALFGLPFLLATCFLGLALASLFRRRETAMQALLFTSLPAIFLAGYSWPPEAIPAPVMALARLVPTTSAIPGFLRIDQMGARLAQVRPELATLGALALAYFALAVVMQRRRWRAA